MSKRKASRTKAGITKASGSRLTAREVSTGLKRLNSGAFRPAKRK